ncbi:MAG: glutamate--tRNA ligase, partial [Rhodobacteraceae bacterium]|nr:glutamate--tRNA ligase [Paracoccaceae bacterium]
WLVARDAITVMADLDGWWRIIRDGAEPLVDDADRDFVAQALAMLPPLPWGPATWGEWTAAVGAATGRKGRGLFRPLRRALTGRDNGPEMADLLPLMQALPQRA